MIMSSKEGIGLSVRGLTGNDTLDYRTRVEKNYREFGTAGRKAVPEGSGTDLGYDCVRMIVYYGLITIGAEQSDVGSGKTRTKEKLKNYTPTVAIRRKTVSRNDPFGGRCTRTAPPRNSNSSSRLWRYCNSTAVSARHKGEAKLDRNIITPVTLYRRRAYYIITPCWRGERTKKKSRRANRSEWMTIINADLIVLWKTSLDTHAHARKTLHYRFCRSIRSRIPPPTVTSPAAAHQITRNIIISPIFLNLFLIFILNKNHINKKDY